MWSLGLSHRSAALILSAFGISLSHMSVWRDLQQAGQAIRQKLMWKRIRVVEKQPAPVFRCPFMQVRNSYNLEFSINPIPYPVTTKFLGTIKVVRRISPRTSLLSILVITLLMSTSCSADAAVPTVPTPTPTVLIITATLPPTQTPLPSQTPVPPTTTVPVAPVEGQTTSQLNVREAPSAESAQLGTVTVFAKVQIVGKDPTGGWWMIVYPESATGTGWVTAEFVQVSDPSKVPVINTGPQATPDAGSTEASPMGETGGAEPPASTPTSFLATAFPDGNSSQSPGVSITLSQAAVRSFNYSSDISSPEGDPEDWVQFILGGQSGQETMVSVVLEPSGSGALNVELVQNGASLQGWENIPCGQRSQLQLTLFAGAPYSLRLWPAPGNGSVSYIAYTVIVQLVK